MNLIDELSANNSLKELQKINPQLNSFSLSENNLVGGFDEKMQSTLNQLQEEIIKKGSESLNEQIKSFDDYLIQQSPQEHLVSLNFLSNKTLGKPISDTEPKNLIIQENKNELNELKKEKEEQENKIKELKSKIEKTKENEVENKKLQDELDKLKTDSTEKDLQINELNNKLKIQENISIAINLMSNNEHYKDEKEQINKRIKFFDNGGFASISLAIFVAVMYIFYLLGSTFYGFDDFKESRHYLSFLSFIFPTVFLSAISFMFYRQSNLKYKELSKINKRIHLLNDIKSSLKALTQLNEGNELKDKAKQVLDDLIKTLLKQDKAEDEKDSEEVESFTDTLSEIGKSLKTISQGILVKKFG